MFSKRSLPDFAWVFAAAFAVRLLVLSRFAASAYFLPTSGDMKFYATWALHIASGQWTDYQAFYGLPGYPFLLAGLFSLIGFDVYAVGLLQTLSEAGIAALIFQTAAWVFPGPRARWVGALAALGWIMFQPAQAFSVILMPTTWAVLAFWGIFLWSVRTESGSRWRPWLGIGAVTGFVATLVATVLFILPISLATAARRLRKPTAVLATAACLAAGVLIGTSPCWLHNRFVAGEPVWLSAHSGLNFWVGNHPGANGYPQLPPELRRASQDGMLRDSIRVARNQAGRPLRNSEVSQFWSAKAESFIHDHPGQWIALIGTKIRNFWNATQYDDLSVINPLRECRVTLPGLRFGAVAVLALAAVPLLWRRWPRSRWVFGAVLLQMAALLPVFITERYRLAAVPGLLLLASGGIVDFGEALFDGLKTRAWKYAATFSCAAVLVLIPGHENTAWLDTYNSALKALQNGDMEQAARKLDIAQKADPGNAEVQTSIGNYLLRTGDKEKAKAAYLHALKLDPENPVALNNLGLLEMTEDDLASAKAHFEAALKIEPHDASLKELIQRCSK